MIEKEFIPYDRALRMKALGFDEPCLAFYYDKTKFLSLGENPKYLVDQRKASYIFGNEKHGVTLAPTFSQAFRWFRKNHNLNYWIQNATASWAGYVGNVPTFIPYIEEVKGPNKFNGFDTYEEAELACLDKLIEIVEKKS